MNFISTYNLDTKNLKLVDYDCTKSDSWGELICENEGSFNKEDEYLVFDMNGLELIVSYDLSVSGKIDYYPGDYYTPSFTDVEITDEDITITQVTLDDYEIEITKDLNLLFLGIIKKYV